MNLCLQPALNTRKSGPRMRLGVYRQSILQYVNLSNRIFRRRAYIAGLSAYESMARDGEWTVYVFATVLV